MGTHDGHRERLKQRFLKHGLDSFNDLNALELFLFFAIPRQDTNALAHRLLDRFGSLAAVLEAPVEQLREVDGVGENTVTLLKLIPQMDRRYQISKSSGVRQIRTSEDAGQILVPLFRYEREENIYLLSLDSRKVLIACDKLGKGTHGEATISARAVVELALKHNAAGVIIAHNHVDGFAIPSTADKMATGQIRDALRLVGITLCDHIVVSGSDFVSFADSGLLNLGRL